MNTIPYWVNENRNQVWQDECIELRRQVRELKERVKRLEEAVARMFPHFSNRDTQHKGVVADGWEEAMR